MLQSSLPTFVLRHRFYRPAAGTPPKIGSGGGSCAHGGRVYEARLNLILPVIKWWSRWVTLPHQLACRASALLVCHDPKIKIQQRTNTSCYRYLAIPTHGFTVVV